MFIKDSSGQYIPAKPDQIIQRAKNIVSTKYKRLSKPLDTPDKTVEFLEMQFGLINHEKFGMLFLDNKNRVIAFEFVSDGTIDGASVYPREIVKHALRHNAAAVILTHNHPSGDPTPSTADKVITARLKESLALVDIRILDHIIIGETSYSFMEHGNM